jgi:P4 family phage/plasmid primase-like protien
MTAEIIRPTRPWDKPKKPVVDSEQPSQDEAAKFLGCLDATADFFTFQTFDDNRERDDPKLARILHGTLQEHWQHLVHLNQQGAGIFVTINVTDRNGRSKENIVGSRAVFCDLDGAPLEPVLRNGRMPHIVVQSSPGRWHPYWKVIGLELTEFEAIQLRLAKQFNSDPSVKDLPRVMRLPGFFHCKDAPFLVRVLQINDVPPYPADHFRSQSASDDDVEQQEFERACEKISNAKEGQRNIELNNAAFFAGQLIGAGKLDETTARSRLTKAGRDARLGDREIQGTINSGITAGKKQTGIILDPEDPMRSARELVGAFFMKNGQLLLHRHRGAYWSWTGSYFRLADDEVIRGQIWNFLERARRLAKKGLVSFKPKQAHVGNMQDALAAICQLDGHIDPPSWLQSKDMPPPSEFLACANGLLHLPSGDLYPHTPEFFGLSASEVEFNPDAPEPTRWLTFLGQLFEADIEAIEALQDFFGYCLTPDTSQQKILLIVGPKRSGKGTMAKILTALLGRQSVAGPTMGSLGQQFGLEPLITAPLAIVSDARIGSHTDKSVVVERLLSISGEDQLTIDRKYRSSWNGRLPTRFAIITNELPGLTDGSGALAGRFIILLLTKSFFGQEDHRLADKLMAELPGILNWAIVGYRRLRERGYFVEEIELLAAPVKAFIQDCCDVGPGLKVVVDDLWSEYQSWSVDQGHSAGNKKWFGRNLRAAVPGLDRSRLTEPEGDGHPWDADRKPTYVGIALKPSLPIIKIDKDKIVENLKKKQGGE